MRIAALKSLMLGALLLGFAGFVLLSLMEDVPNAATPRTGLQNLPDYDYLPDILALREQGRLGEALEMARFVLRHEDMPGQAEAKGLEEELVREQELLRSRAMRVASGFITGSGTSIEELSGGIASDMVLYGDLRDLIQQGYYRVSGQETDPLVAALAGLGLLTELVDVADWAPAVLKAFRKVGALSDAFADFVLKAATKSARTRKLDAPLKQAFTDLRSVTENMGLARTAGVFRRVQGPEDLAALASVAGRNADAAYFAIRNGGDEGLDMLRRASRGEIHVADLSLAAKKGPAGVEWLRRGGEGRKVLLSTRYGARLAKSLRLERPQRWLREAAQWPPVRSALVGVAGLSALAGMAALIRARRLLRDARKAALPPAV